MAESDSEQRAQLLGRVLNLVGLVDYQEAAIVSRTLVDKPAGTITLFAFDSGQALSEHTAPYDALAYLLEGEMEVTLAGAAHPLRAGEMVLMPANVPHALRASERAKLLLVMVRG